MEHRHPDVNRGGLVDTVSWVMFGVSLAVLLGRIWARARILKVFGLDDAFMVLAWICAALNSILVTVSVSHGTGRRIYYLSDREKMLANKYNWLSQPFHVLSTNWAKISVMLFLLRIIEGAKHQARYFYAGMFVILVVNVVGVGVILGQCMPVNALWNPDVDGKCWNPRIHRNYAFFQSAFSAFSDLVLAVYPVYVVARLQMPTRMKATLGTILALGLIAMAAAIVKTVYIASLAERADYTWNMVDLLVWVFLEQYLIIIAACIPMLGPLVKSSFEKASKASKYLSYRQQHHPSAKGNTAVVTTGETGSSSLGKYKNKFGRDRSRPYPVKETSYPLRKFGNGSQDTNTISEEDLIDPESGRSGIMEVREVYVKIEDAKGA